MDPGTTIAASGSRGRKTKPAEQTRIGKRASREDTVHVGFLYAGSVRPTASDRATGCAQSAAWLWHNRFRGLRRPLTERQNKTGRHTAPRFKQREFGSYAFLRRRRISPNPARAVPKRTRLAGSGTT